MPVLPLGGRWTVECFLYVLNRAITYSPVWCYSFNFKSFCVLFIKKTKFYVALYEMFISRRLLALSSAKYKVLRRVLAPSSSKYKVPQFRYASWQVNCSALFMEHAFTLLANRIQATYYWVTVWAAYFKICVLRLFTQAVLCYLITNS